MNKFSTKVSSKDDEQLSLSGSTSSDDTLDADTTSSFSLQECLDEFRARRIRRVSTHSREMTLEDYGAECSSKGGVVGKQDNSVDVDLINQNRCNKEQERKCKPCKDGFCYCFTSDSGDGACSVTRDQHLRQARRSRKSESSQHSNMVQYQQRQQRSNSSDGKHQRRQSAPAKIHIKQPPHQPLKTVTSQTVNKSSAATFTTISSLKESTEDAPLLHIIQELHHNFVVSEVRVNKQKLQTQQSQNMLDKHSCHCQSKISLTKSVEVKETVMPRNDTCYAPSAPTLSNISEIESVIESESEKKVLQSALFEQSLSKNSKSLPHSRKAGGRLLKHRLSNTKLIVKPRVDNQSPPKPPRSYLSLNEKNSVSSWPSTTPSLREAERVLDEFLIKNGVKLPVANQETDKPKNQKMKSHKKSAPLPSCPSLSDIERVVASKKDSNYSKNLHKKSSKVSNVKPLKEIAYGWSEPKINDMLNYDADVKNSEKMKKFITNKKIAEPQQKLGWVMPKVSLDTVDACECHNLASNIEKKETPIKTRIFTNNKQTKGASASKKFIWGEQFRNLSPWQAKPKLPGKSNLKHSSKCFLKHSKKKILRFVSPNKDKSHTSKQRSIGIQTSSVEVDNEMVPNSPPGSYHSPIQSNSSAMTPLSQTDSNETPEDYFDFNREIKSPNQNKKQPRPNRGRKLDFPCCIEDSQHKSYSGTKTYRSYHSELDTDVSLSKMGFLLSNIRGKLEATDQLAIRTFQEVDDRKLSNEGIDCPDSYQRLHSPTRLRTNTSNNSISDVNHSRSSFRDIQNEPIYSEIEENSIHISGSPHVENKAVVVPKSHSQVSKNVEALYAKVVKPPKTKIKPSSPKPLGKLLHDSLQQRRLGATISETPTSGPSYCIPSSTSASSKVFSHSLNNINEQHSPPKQHRHVLSKSELSLQRSELFLDNLCHSELVLTKAEDAGERLAKVDNGPADTSQTMGTLSDADNVSYDEPNDDLNSITENLGTSIIEPPLARDQSTPKKPSPKYTTKPYSSSLRHNSSAVLTEFSNSCPTTPQRQTQSRSPTLHTHSLSDLQCKDSIDDGLSTSALKRYRLIKDALRRSYRKGKRFFKNESGRLHASLNLPSVPPAEQDYHDNLAHNSSQKLDELLNATDTLSTTAQLVHAVSICRQLPELEISPEMVEAERLLLFTSLKQETARHTQARGPKHSVQRFFVDGIKFPVQAVATQDFFFNYYYICTFECAGNIKSTQSVECQNGGALFQDCGIEFFTCTKAEDFELNCKIFMLRLRKVTTLSMEPQKPNIKLQRKSSTSSSSMSSVEAISSRFRLNAIFTLKSDDFKPYELVTAETNAAGQICLRASNDWSIQITPSTRSTNLAPIIQLRGRAEIRFPKDKHSGFLHVQDPHVLHNWNLRWCTLDGLKFCIWQDANDLVQEALITLDLTKDLKSNEPINVATKDVCARPRAFALHCLECVTGFSKICFAADTQSELDLWLAHLNTALAFVTKWL